MKGGVVIIPHRWCFSFRRNGSKSFDGGKYVVSETSLNLQMTIHQPYITTSKKDMVASKYNAIIIATILIQHP